MNDSELQALYRQTVLDHSRHPHNCRHMNDADATAVGLNPLCGDKIQVYVRLDDDSIEELTFEGTGCAISLASASIMTDRLGHASTSDARREIERVMRQFAAREQENAVIEGDMAALGGVRAYPSRIKCATLAWKTLGAALDSDESTVTTEK